MTKKEIIEKMRGRIVKEVKMEADSIMITFHDDYKIEVWDKRGYNNRFVINEVTK
jgi:hypothetical protein